MSTGISNLKKTALLLFLGINSHLMMAQNELSEISKFDENGRLIYNQKDNFSSATYLKTSRTFKYDNKGNILETIMKVFVSQCSSVMGDNFTAGRL